MRVLFVCTGNSCRSPMAELYFNHLAEVCRRPEVEAVSAGIYAWDGARTSQPAAEVMERMGIDHSAFRSRRFTPGLARECDLIIGMSENHNRAMSQIAPDCADKLRLLMDFDRGGDVPDPYGGSTAHYQQVFDRMRPALDNLFKELTSTK